MTKKIISIILIKIKIIINKFKINNKITKMIIKIQEITLIQVVRHLKVYKIDKYKKINIWKSLNELKNLKFHNIIIKIN